MKKSFLALICMALLTLAHAQEPKSNKEKIIIISAETMTSGKSSMTLLGAHVIVDKKLEIEADSIIVTANRTMLTAHRAKSFTFNGKVVLRAQHTGVCKYRLGEDTLVVE